LHEVNRASFNESAQEVAEAGLRRAQNCAGKYREALELLEMVLALVEWREWAEEIGTALRMLYGKKPTWKGGIIIRLYEQVRDADREHARRVNSGPLAQGTSSGGAASRADEPRPSSQRADNEAFAALKLMLHEEIRDVLEEYELYQDGELRLTPARLMAELAPKEGGAWTLMLRQAASLER
jgi:hypothetical protein